MSDETGEVMDPMSRVADELGNVAALVAEQAAEIERLKGGDGGSLRFVGDTTELFSALAKAQGEFPPIRRTKTVSVAMKSGGKYTFDYAPLDQVMAVCAPVLGKHGLACIQPFSAGEPFKLVTILAGHGARVESVIPLSKAEDIKGQGSLITYMRRYCYQAMIGVATDSDDDGNAGSGDSATVSDRGKPAPKAASSSKAKAPTSTKAKDSSPPSTETEAPKIMSAAQANEIGAIVRELDLTDEEVEAHCQDFVGRSKPQKASDYTEQEAEKLVVGLRGVLAAKKEGK